MLNKKIKLLLSAKIQLNFRSNFLNFLIKKVLESYFLTQSFYQVKIFYPPQHKILLI